MLTSSSEQSISNGLQGGVVPPLYGRSSAENPTGRLDKRYDSRSRFFIETERLSMEHEIRLRLQREQQEALTESDSDIEPKLPVPGVLPPTFAAIDTDRRDQAVAILNVETLVRATEAVEEEANKPEPSPIPVIPNSDAFGLQTLVAATEVQFQKPEAPHPTSLKVEPTDAMPPPYHVNVLPDDRMSIDVITSPLKSSDGEGNLNHQSHFVDRAYFGRFFGASGLASCLSFPAISHQTSRN
jgi:hypothetical protein